MAAVKVARGEIRRDARTTTAAIPLPFLVWIFLPAATGWMTPMLDLPDNLVELRPADDPELLRPLLGEIGRMWQRTHPLDLTAPEALRLLSLLTEITDRLDTEAGITTAPVSVDFSEPRRPREGQ